ncbi:MAG: hypothetical protein H0X25_00765 [Acidobacteriales bacterium]|nr:hypothetical protein [Terriglobales bacterium]
MSPGRLKALKLFLLACVVLMLTMPLYAAQEKTLVTFHHGALPSDGLVAWQGKLYGSTEYGGQYGLGTIFELSESGGVFSEKVIYNFQPDHDNGGPMWKVTFDRVGNLYGTSPNGGLYGLGAIYRLAPENGTWTGTILYSFTGGNDGADPDSKLTFDPEGNLYGATTFGGSTGYGVIFQLTPSGDQWTETTIHAFNGPTDGRSPQGLVLTQDGHLLGFGCQSGPAGNGTIFQLKKAGEAWQFTVLYDFSQPNDSSFITGSPVLDAQGRIYGSSSAGGTDGKGTLFRFDQTTGVSAILHNFKGKPEDGASPDGDLLLDPQGRVWGVTSIGGMGNGTIFAYTPSDNSYQVLYEFFGQNMGHFPNGGLIEDANGNLYGTTEEGGPNQGSGTVFQVKP